MAKAKPKSKPIKPCNCANLLAKALLEKHVEPVRDWQLNFSTGKVALSGLQIALRKRSDAPRRTKVPTLFCTFCPCCGQRLIADSPA